MVRFDDGMNDERQGSTGLIECGRNRVDDERLVLGDDLDNRVLARPAVRSDCGCEDPDRRSTRLSAFGERALTHNGTDEIDRVPQDEIIDRAIRVIPVHEAGQFRDRSDQLLTLRVLQCGVNQLRYGWVSDFSALHTFRLVRGPRRRFDYIGCFTLRVIHQASKGSVPACCVLNRLSE